MATNYTPNLHLPQWVAGDKPNFLSEINGAWSSIDLGYGQNKTDAATAITTANGASANAQDAVSKVNALSAQLVTMQQTIAQLESDFINRSYIVNDVPLVTPIEGVQIIANAIHNGYVGYVSGAVTLNEGSYSSENNVVVVGTIKNLPYTYKTLTGQSEIAPLQKDVSITSGAKSPALCEILLSADGNFGFVTPSTLYCSGTVSIRYFISFPISAVTNARNNMVDNCAYL